VAKGSASLIKPKVIMPKDAPLLRVMESLRAAFAPMDTPYPVQRAVVPPEAPSLMGKKKRKAGGPETLAELPEHVRNEREGRITLTEARAGSFTLATRGDAVINVTDRTAVGGTAARSLWLWRSSPRCAPPCSRRRGWLTRGCS
jgi:hypothetical protein